MRVCLQTRLGKMLAETAETNSLQLILTDWTLIKREIIFAIQTKIYCFLSNGTEDTRFNAIFMQQTQPKDDIFSTQVNTVQASVYRNTQLFLEESERRAIIWCKKEHFTVRVNDLYEI